MPRTFQLNILTPEETLYKGDCVSLRVPAFKGELGVLANHAPLLARLKPGRIIVRDAEDVAKTFQSERNGYIEVLNNNVKVLLGLS